MSLGSSRAILSCAPAAESQAATPVAVQQPAATRVDFNRDIRHILSNNCFKCHGPDAAERKSGLRLDIRDRATQPAETGEIAVVPGKPSESELVRRIFSTDPGYVMPPPAANRKLTVTEKDLLKRWIEQGAVYEQHWSFVVPQRPKLPQVKDSAWPRNAIDRFVLARLEAEGLKPAPEAGRVNLIRRLALDLTGLPPAPGDVDAFVADNSPQAYERVVDRLLASPHFGERMAVEWLDAARFADTNGYHLDNGRDMSRWREWVIAAFNRNLPFDQFTIQQLAGDLLPDVGDPIQKSQHLIASGFNRNHMINFEGGAIPQEYHTAYIVDRVNTTGTVWLGLTIGCTQCHDHKFDPLTQREFYQLFAFFHNVPENGLDGGKGNAAPLIKVPTAEQQKSLDQLAASIRQVEEQMNGPQPEADLAQAEWERTAGVEKKTEWTLLDPTDLKSQGGAGLRKLDDKSVLASGENPATEIYTIVARSNLKGITAIRLEVFPDDSLPARGPGRSSNGNVVLTGVRLNAASAVDAAPGKAARFAKASADFSQQDYPVANAIDDKPTSGWAIYPEVGKPHTAVFELEQAVNSDGDGAEGVALTVVLEFQSQFAQHQFGKFRLSVTNSRMPHGAQSLPPNIAKILAVTANQRTNQQKGELRTFYRTTYATTFKQLNEQLAKLKKASADLEKQIPTTMVMQEMPQPRETFLLVRGQYDKRGDKVVAGVPASLPALPEGAPANRLGLAKWLVDPRHPLTSRVTVNRYWQMLFGTGLVKTSEDFGTQGEMPSHPDLLDWLAVEFMHPGDAEPSATAGRQEPFPPATPASSARTVQRAGNWDIKALIKQMVMSATYRQSAVVTPALLARDPENRLLTRGARLRLPAEFIRDQALAVSGLLDPRIGGPSVSPYQPAGLWEELASRLDGANWTAQTYTQSHGPDLYRRTMYTFWKRTSPPPTLVTFDAPDRETCTVRRARTNTPLQALILLNDPTYVEASRKLAERILAEGGKTPDERIRFAFRQVLARSPAAGELSILKKILDEQLAAFRTDTGAAAKLLKVGESAHDAQLNPAELAAWSMVASILLNLDETLTKG